MLALLPRNHPLAQAKAYPLTNCATDRFIMPARGCDDDVMALFRRNHIVPNVQFTTLESFSVMSMVEQGLGISIVPRLLIRGRAQNLAVRPLEPQASRTIALAIPAGEALPVVDAFARTAIDWVRTWEASAVTESEMQP